MNTKVEDMKIKDLLTEEEFKKTFDEVMYYEIENTMDEEWCYDDSKVEEAKYFLSLSDSEKKAYSNGWARMFALHETDRTVGEFIKMFGDFYEIVWDKYEKYETKQQVEN